MTASAFPVWGFTDGFRWIWNDDLPGLPSLNPGLPSPSPTHVRIAIDDRASWILVDVCDIPRMIEMLQRAQAWGARPCAEDDGHIVAAPVTVTGGYVTTVTRSG